MDDDSMYVLHWLPDENRWVEVGRDDFSALREMFVPFQPLPGLAWGVHYFVVCICNEGETVNIIPHKYLVEPSGRIGRDNFYGWNREEREEFNRLMLASELKPGDQEKLHVIQAKGGYAMYPPRDCLYPLVRALPYPPAKSSPAVRFLDEVGTGKGNSL
jgi:hypothetical protein